MASERSEYFGCGLAILIFGLVLLFFFFLLRGCTVEENKRKDELQQKRQEFENQQLTPSNWTSPNFFPRYQHPLSRVNKINNLHWEIFLTPHTVDFEDRKKTYSTAFYLGLEKHNNNYAEYTDAEDDGYLTIGERIPMGDENNYISIDAHNQKTKFFVLVMSGEVKYREFYFIGKARLYQWHFSDVWVSRFKIKLSTDSPILADTFKITFNVARF